MGILIKASTIKHGYDIRICQDTFLHIRVDNCISCHLLTLPKNGDHFNTFAYVNTIALSIKKTTHVQYGYTVASASGSYLNDWCDIDNWKNITKIEKKNVVIFESRNEFENCFVRWRQPSCLNQNITQPNFALMWASINNATSIIRLWLQLWLGQRSLMVTATILTISETSDNTSKQLITLFRALMSFS